jgi:acid stress chaperone HdeB
MKFVDWALAIGILVCCSTAFAANVDLSTWTCRKFQTADKADVGVTLAWLDGYYKGKDAPPIIDTEKIVADAKKVGEYCLAHPDIGLIAATDKLLKASKRSVGTA